MNPMHQVPNAMNMLYFGQTFIFENLSALGFRMPVQDPKNLGRLLSLDVFRGLTIAAMILVTDPGTYSARYWFLAHATWDHPTPTDLIFPAFLLIVGLALPFAFASRLERTSSRHALFIHVMRRTILLIAVGLFLNAIPFFDLHHLRIPGILQRIALCYLLVSFPYLFAQTTRTRIVTLIASAIGCFVLYWTILRYIPTPGFGAGYLDPLRNLPSFVDRKVFGIAHLWQWGIRTPGYGITFDPEGILSTLGALTTTLIGAIAGEYLRLASPPERKAVMLFLSGVNLVILGRVLSPAMPLIKNIWTPTFAIGSAGFTLAVFAALYYLIDVREYRKGLAPARIFGTNAILAFAISTIFTTAVDSIHFSTAASPNQNLHGWLYSALFQPWLTPIHASLAYAVAIVLLNLLLIYPLYRRHIFVRIWS